MQPTHRLVSAQHCLPFDGINGADAKIMGSRVSVAGGEPAFLLPLHVPFWRRFVLQGNCVLVILEVASENVIKQLTSHGNIK